MSEVGGGDERRDGFEVWVCVCEVESLVGGDLGRVINIEEELQSLAGERKSLAGFRGMKGEGREPVESRNALDGIEGLLFVDKVLITFLHLHVESGAHLPILLPARAN